MLNYSEKDDGLPSALMVRIKQCLASRQAMGIELILKQMEAGNERVMSALSRLVAMQEVEVLRPVSVAAGGGRRLTFHPLEYYRLVRPTDRDCAWQVEIRERPAEVSWMMEREMATVSVARHFSHSVRQHSWLRRVRQSSSVLQHVPLLRPAGVR